MHDIEGMTIEALAELRDAVTARLADRVAARQRELADEASKLGVLVEGRAKPPKRAPKYRNGDETWSGNGSQPKWVRDHLAGGGTLERLKV